jgi:SAM-dependent methyltransferase
MRPEQYDRLYECEPEMWWFVGMRRILSTLLGPLARPGRRCLEAGCGTGFNALFFAREYGWQVFPFDPSERAVRYATLRGAGRVVRASADRLPYAGSAFDCVTCLDVLYMISAEQCVSALAEMHRVLRPGGFLLARAAALPKLGGGHGRAVGEVRRFRLAELAGEVEAAGFRVRRATYANMLLLPAAVVKRRLLEPLRLASASGDAVMPGAISNRLFLAALEAENALLKRFNRLPIGLSAIVLALK